MEEEPRLNSATFGKLIIEKICVEAQAKQTEIKRFQKH